MERWSTWQLQQKIQSLLYERTAISRTPGHLIRRELARLRDEDRVSPYLVFEDPYFLDFSPRRGHSVATSCGCELVVLASGDLQVA